jgi:tetratricopeptide (TPR) repeat protein
MMAAGAGYGELGKNSRSSAIMSRAAECKPVTVEEQLAVTEALAAMGRVPQAEKQLADEQARNPNDPRVVAGLARLYQATGRNLQAIEKYREAVRLDSHNVRYREGLARELLGGGLLDECTGECQAILGSDPTNAAALRMLNQIKLMRGNVGLDETFVRAGAGAPTGLPLAQVCLGTGRTEKCIEICLAELKKTPNNIEARSLLGFAYSLLGQNDRSAEQWKAALQGAPAQLIPYMQLADVLARSMKPEEVEAAIAAVPGAKRDWIDFAMAWLSDRAGQYDAAAETYGRVLARQDVSADTRNRVRALRAQVLCRAGRVEESMAELDRLAEIPGERISALFTKGALLAAMGRAKEADPILTGLQQLAVKNKNEVLLGRLISLQMDMRQTDKALAACNELEELLPGDPRPYVARAGVLAAADRLDEASECCRKAIERQPGDYRTRLTLARLLDVADKPIPAIEALRQLEAQGQAARCLALLEFGDMLSRWGLAAQAAEKYEQVAKQGYEGDPRLQLALANAFAQVGNKGRAREVIAKIPAYAPQYVAANLILVGLENAEEEKLQILRQVRKAKPGQPAVLVQEMSILVRANRPADVAKALQEYMADKAAAGALPEQACFLALQAMLLNQDSRAAAGLAVQMARGTRSPIWRQVAALLVIDVDPAAARSFIAGAAEAGPCDAMLGLVLASRTGQEAAPWKSRLDELQKSLSQLTPPRSIPARARFLAALAAGARAEAESELVKWTGAPATDRQAAAELLAAAKEPNASAEAAELLKASVAADLGLPLMARDSAMKLLKARPACQWAAVLAGQCDADGLLSREILQTLQPADCLLAQTIRARLASKEKQYEKAAGIWWTVAAAEKDNPETLMDLGAALENAGRLEDALAVYRKVWETDRRPLAANNAAFLVSLLWPQDSAKLAEASRWMAEAVKAAPAGASFRDTLGWIAHLQGRDEEACLELRRAVKGLPDSPEVHYHLGVVEAAAGRTELASWHLAAAVNIGDRLKAEKRGMAPACQQAVRSAQEALAKLVQPKS